MKLHPVFGKQEGYPLPKLIILRGNSGSGKTTVAKELQKKLGGNTTGGHPLLLSQDVVRRDMLKVKDGPHNEATLLLMELLKYGHEHNEITILEGILYADWYRPLFELARRLYGDQIYAWYFDLPFEETLRRHQTKPNCNEFGAEAMKRWWREKDFSDVLSEKSITAEISFSDIISEICGTVQGNEN